MLFTLFFAEVGGCSLNFPRLETTVQQTAAISVEAIPMLTAPLIMEVINNLQVKNLAGYRQTDGIT